MALAFAQEREGPSPIPTDHRQRPGNASFQAAVAFSRDMFVFRAIVFFLAWRNQLPRVKKGCCCVIDTPFAAD